MNLIQVGGGQNTFGQAMSPGSGVAENANVVAGVGQGAPQILASGSFSAPSACGTYTFELTDAVANVLLERNDPPAFSPVTQPAIDTSAASISFTIALVGDLDFDGDVDLADLAPLLYCLQGPATTYVDTHFCRQMDMTGDADVDLGDFAAFQVAFTGPLP